MSSAAGAVMRGGRAVFTCLLIIAAVIVVVPPEHASAPSQVSYARDLARLTRVARYPVVAPGGLPRGWRPDSSVLTLGGANGPRTATWQLGYMTPSGHDAALEETDASPAAFVRRMTNSGTSEPQARVSGRAWNVAWTAGRGQRSLYYTSQAGVTVVVTGNATWPELRALAGSLRAQPR